jgi:cysteine desulfurase
LDLAGCAVSRGAACMAVRGEPSHVIAALGIEPSLAMGTIRISIGWTTTAAELAQFVDAYALCIGTR